MAGAWIEVTPEMVQAGLDASFVWDKDSREVCVEAIIKAALNRVDPTAYRAIGMRATVMCRNA